MNKKMQELKKLAAKADEKEIKVLMQVARMSGISKEEIGEIKKSYSLRGKAMKIPTKTKIKTLSERIYSEEINKIKFISNNDDLIEKIKGLKILFFGKTGTGKTTVIKDIITSLLKDDNNEFKEINFERMISHKMGQSQINLLNLSENIKIASKSKRQIIFLDELDSIVSNRSTINDIGEHHRIVATFIKFIDDLPQNSIIFSATNMPKKIDEAILRRFTLKVKGKEIELREFLKYLKSEFGVSSNKFNKFIDYNKLNHTFTISDLNDFGNELALKNAMEKNEIDPFVNFISFFNGKFEIPLIDISNRTKTALKKGGVNV